MKRVTIILLTILFIIISAGGFLAYSINDVIKNPLKVEEETVIIDVEKGTTFYSLLEDLNAENKIKNPELIKVALKYTGIVANIKAGEYEVSKNINLENLVNTLSTGNLTEGNIKVTIPEGYTVEDISQILDEKNIINKEDFLSYCKEFDNPIVDIDDENIKYEVEGFLFPDTYMFKENTNADVVLAKLIDRYSEVVSDITNGKNYSSEEIYGFITIASMIEEEAKVDEERSLVSSVIYNRIEQGMPLQLCATVIYALGYHKDVLLNKDLEIDSPYNTYNSSGLPVGPISNPGKASIEAAINPSDTNYIYYVYDNEGKHFFTDNYNEFLKAKERYKANN